MENITYNNYYNFFNAYKNLTQQEKRKSLIDGSYNDDGRLVRFRKCTEEGIEIHAYKSDESIDFWNDMHGVVEPGDVERILNKTAIQYDLETYALLENGVFNGLLHFDYKNYSEPLKDGYKYVEVDINSAYPSIMRNGYPYGELTTSKPNGRYMTFYKVRFESLDPNLWVCKESPFGYSFLEQQYKKINKNREAIITSILYNDIVENYGEGVVTILGTFYSKFGINGKIRKIIDQFYNYKLLNKRYGKPSNYVKLQLNSIIGKLKKRNNKPEYYFIQENGDRFKRIIYNSTIKRRIRDFIARVKDEKNDSYIIDYINKKIEKDEKIAPKNNIIGYMYIIDVCRHRLLQNKNIITCNTDGAIIQTKEITNSEAIGEIKTKIIGKSILALGVKERSSVRPIIVGDNWQCFNTHIGEVGEKIEYKNKDIGNEGTGSFLVKSLVFSDVVFNSETAEFTKQKESYLPLTDFILKPRFEMLKNVGFFYGWTSEAETKMKEYGYFLLDINKKWGKHYFLRMFEKCI